MILNTPNASDVARWAAVLRRHDVDPVAVSTDAVVEIDGNGSARLIGRIEIPLDSVDLAVLFGVEHNAQAGIANREQNAQSNTPDEPSEARD